MKSLGQIAYEAAYPEFEQWANWSDPTNVTGKRWEAAAQAVRAAVLAEMGQESVVYVQCNEHKGMAWSFRARAAAPYRAVCPNCILKNNSESQTQADSQMEGS